MGGCLWLQRASLGTSAHLSPPLSFPCGFSFCFLFFCFYWFVDYSPMNMRLHKGTVSPACCTRWCCMCWHISSSLTSWPMNVFLCRGMVSPCSTRQRCAGRTKCWSFWQKRSSINASSAWTPSAIRYFAFCSRLYMHNVSLKNCQGWRLAKQTLQYEYNTPVRMGLAVCRYMDMLCPGEVA